MDFNCASYTTGNSHVNNTPEKNGSNIRKPKKIYKPNSASQTDFLNIISDE